MKPYIFVYCEGSDTKIVVASKEKDEVKIHRTIDLNLFGGKGEASELGEESKDLNMEGMSGDFSLEDLESNEDEKRTSYTATEIGTIAEQFEGINLSSARFIPIGTEPGMNYHIYEGAKEKDKHKQILAITTDIEQTKNIYVAPDAIDYIPYNDHALLAAFFENAIPCVDLLNHLAEYHKKRNYKIETIKSADISLAYYVANTIKFFPEDYTLIIYTGKEYSKLIFLQGGELKHIGATLDIGTSNLSTYDVYFSKILLEMENGGIPQLDNVILCGEDRSENLILSFYGTFPEANVTELEFDKFSLEQLPNEEKSRLPDYAIPLAVAKDFFDEQDKKHKGINILPKYIVEKQKILQFGWHSYILMPLIFLTTLLFTYLILNNNRSIEDLNSEITRVERLQKENQEIMDQITPLSERIESFDVTKSILDSATTGTEIWGKTFDDISDFIERRRNFWISSIQNPNRNEVRITGFSLSRSVLTEFTDYLPGAVLESVTFEPLREKSAFAYNLTFSINGNSNGQIVNQPPGVKNGP